MAGRLGSLRRARGSLDVTVVYAFTGWAEVRSGASNLLNEHEIVYLADASGKDSKIGARAHPVLAIRGPTTSMTTSTAGTT
jgi:hypothetical protein